MTDVSLFCESLHPSSSQTSSLSSLLLHTHVMHLIDTPTLALCEFTLDNF